MSRVAVTGAAGPAGRRLCGLLDRDPSVDRVVAIDRRPLGDLGAKVDAIQAPLLEADLDTALAGIDVVCHLAGSDPLEEAPVDHDLHTTARLLGAAERAGVGQVIVRSSATVYGAWPDNPVPLTEAAIVRPNAETAWVRMRGRIEEQVRTFAAEHPETAVAILRPCVTVSPEGPDELGRVLGAARLVAPSERATRVQYLHVDDLVSAIDAVRRQRAEGIFNVAPDGSIDVDFVRALSGGSPRLPLPEWLARRLTAFGWRYRVAPTPPGFVPFVTHPWVVANDRLRAVGWTPEHGNDEAYVAGHDAAPWAQVSPQRRQELALGVSVVGLLAAVGATVLVVRRRLSGRRGGPGAVRRGLSRLRGGRRG